MEKSRKALRILRMVMSCLQRLLPVWKMAKVLLLKDLLIILVWVLQSSMFLDP